MLAMLNVGGGEIFVAFAALVFVFWIWMLVDCIKNTRLSETEKITWVLLIIFLHALGALIYYLVGRNQSATRAGTVNKANERL